MDPHNKLCMSLHALLVLSVFMLLIQASTSIEINRNDGPLIADSFPHQERLDPKYVFQWKFNSTHIMFKISVRTHGYIGFGISEHGKMYPSDVIIAWVKDGEVFFHDRHATAHVMPVVDDHQDWYLISGSEDDNETTITTVRPLITCDKQDYPITEGTTRLIYSYNENDPSSENDVQYHGHDTRGSKSVLLLNPTPRDDGKNELPDDVTTIDFRNQNYTVPADDTTYSCTIMKLPPLQGKHHLIKYEPIIQPGHEGLVHHVVLYYCDQPIPDGYVGWKFMCYNGEYTNLESTCQNTFIAWAIGGSAFVFPPHVGYSLGTPDDPVYFRLETHYDNTQKRSDFVDNSGLRLYLTKQLRQQDAGMLTVGVEVGNYQIIPPQSDNFVSRAYCSEECLAKGLDHGEIHVFAALPHAHLAGRAISARLVRNGEELAPIVDDASYDFNFQESRLLTKERVIKKGDMIMTECHYNTMKRNTVTYGGLSSREEMCITYLLYYPRTEMKSCFSRLRYTNSSIPMYDEGVPYYAKNANWTKSVRDEFARNTAQSDVYNMCFFNQTTEKTSSLQPKRFKPYVPDTQCTEIDPVGNSSISIAIMALHLYLACFGLVTLQWDLFRY